MRTIVLALVFVAAVYAGTWLAQSTDVLVLPVLFGGSTAVMAAGWLVERKGQRAHLGTALVFTALLVCAGLMRGASVSGPAQLRVSERGVGARVELRELEVVGASEPGPRCRLKLRDPRAPWSSPVLVVQAPATDCPRSHGQRVAVIARSLRPGWRAALLERDAVDLGRGPVMWARPPAARTKVQHLVDRYWAGVAALRQRAWFATRGDPQASLVVASALGLRAALEPDSRRKLRAAGLGHLIAVSGLHVALAAIWFTALARRVAAAFGAPPELASVGAWLPLWIYVGLTGGAPSAIRAAAMLTALELGAVVGRPSHGPTLLALVAGLMLFVQPAWALEPGFTLSVAAMAAIVSADRGLGVLALSWRISWATAPLSVIYFEHAPLHGLVGNLVALPMFALMMPLGLVASVASGVLAELAMSGARIFAAPILDLAELLARVPSLGADALGVLALALRGLAWSLGSLDRSGDSDSDDRRLRWWQAWAPPRLACWAAVALALGLHVVRPAEPPSRPELDWLALGSSHSYAILAVAQSAEASACLYRPTGGAATWVALFEQLGVRRLARLDADLPPTLDPARSDPQTRALALRLREAGIELSPSSATAVCAPVERAEIRAALKTCRFIQGRPSRALARSWQGRVECRIEARWVPVDP